MVDHDTTTGIRSPTRINTDGLAQGLVAPARVVARFGQRKPLGAIGAVIVLILALIALLAPAISPYDPRHLTTSSDGSSTVYVPHNSQFLLGTDHIGRDVLSRIFDGARISLRGPGQRANRYNWQLYSGGGPGLRWRKG